jgi:hypothetical protein
MGTKIFKISSLMISTVVLFLGCVQDASSQTKQPPRLVRVTNATVSIPGWEHKLVKHNRNLEHFHWSPILTVARGPLIISRGINQKTKKRNLTRLNPARPLVYRKPIHVKPGQYSNSLAGELQARSTNTHAHATGKVDSRSVEARLSANDGNKDGLLRYSYAGPNNKNETTGTAAVSLALKQVTGQILRRDSLINVQPIKDSNKGPS